MVEEKLVDHGHWILTAKAKKLMNIIRHRGVSMVCVFSFPKNFGVDSCSSFENGVFPGV